MPALGIVGRMPDWVSSPGVRSALRRSRRHIPKGMHRTSADGSSPYLTREQAAKFLNVSQATLDRRPIRRIKDGRLVQYDVADLIAYKESCKEGAPSPVRFHRPKTDTRLPSLVVRRQVKQAGRKLSLHEKLGLPPFKGKGRQPTLFEELGIKPPPPRPRIE